MRELNHTTIFVPSEKLLRLSELYDKTLDEERAVEKIDLDEVCGDDICNRKSGYCHWCGRSE